jgi:hypothetical protein
VYVSACSRFRDRILGNLNLFSIVSRVENKVIQSNLCAITEIIILSATELLIKEQLFSTEL